ncbi:MAG: Gfo/Idh/MocA family oxidoreductase [Microcoleaceae cyanobacterium]
MFWQSENWVSLYGEQGTLKFTPEQGELLTGETSRVLSVEARRGLFQRDTEAVLEHLCTGQALYVTAADSFYTLQVAVAAQHSAALHQPIQVAGIDE